jgi:Zn-dependent protease with chaperone function
MDFFERQDRARRRTGLLVVYFALAVVLLIAVVYAVAVLVLSAQQPLNLELLGWVSLGTVGVILIGMLVKTAELARGGRAVAEMLGGQLLNPNTTDPDERKLLNVVEEMALASGVPVPAVYVLRQEAGINAFAAGHHSSDAAVGVTRGAIQLLNRDELQGVIAHEFSHILNGDMRLNVRLIGWIFGIMCLALIGRILLYARGGGSQGGKANALPLIGLALILVGWIGVLFGRLIQAAVSRQREFLADAAAVQFTRNPAGLAGALKKVGGVVHGSKVANPRAAEAGHLFFGSALEGALAGMFATHPPLTQRIRALEPSFDGKFPRVSLEAAAAPTLDRGRSTAPPPPLRPPAAVGVAALAGGSASPPRRVDLRGGDYRARFGAPQAVHLVKAAEILEQLPEELRDTLHDGLGASAIVYALLLGGDEGLRNRQLHTLSLRISGAMADETRRMRRYTASLPVEHRLPLLELAASGLRELSPTQFQQFKNTTHALAEMDGEIDLFEYVLLKVVLHGVEPFFAPPGRRVIEFYSLKPLLTDCTVLVSGLAHLGHTDASQAQVAFTQGMAELPRGAGPSPALLPMANCGLAAVDQALDRIARATPQIRKQVLSACAVAVASDGSVQPGEAELLRAVALTLDCPLPPFVQ